MAHDGDAGEPQEIPLRQPPQQSAGAGGRSTNNLDTLRGVVESMETRAAKFGGDGGGGGTTDPAGPASPAADAGSRPSYSGYMNRILGVVDRLIGHLNENEGRERERAAESQASQARLSTLQREHDVLEQRMSSTEARCHRLEHQMSGGTQGGDRIPPGLAPAVSTAAAYPMTSSIAAGNMAMSMPSNPVPLGAAYPVYPASVSGLSDHSTDLRTRLEAADAALSHLKREMPEAEAYAPSPGRPAVFTGHLGSASPYRSQLSSWNNESPLRAAVESAAAATGLSVQELLGGSASAMGAVPTAAETSAYSVGGSIGGKVSTIRQTWLWDMAVRHGCGTWL